MTLVTSRVSANQGTHTVCNEDWHWKCPWNHATLVSESLEESGIDLLASEGQGGVIPFWHRPLCKPPLPELPPCSRSLSLSIYIYIYTRNVDLYIYIYIYNYVYIYIYIYVHISIEILGAFLNR